MSHSHTRLRHVAPIALGLVLASLLLAACGSSSSPTTTSATAQASTTSTNPTQGGQRFLAFSECLEKNGIKLPKRTPGSPPTSGGLIGPGGSLQLPSGVTRAQFEAAAKKCGSGAGGPRARLTSPRFVQALGKFAACMRQNGVNVPAPNTTGNGPVFNTKGLNTATTAFIAARTKCAPLLSAGFRRVPGAPPAG